MRHSYSRRRREPARDLRPSVSAGGGAHEQPEMRAGRDLRADLTLLTANKTPGGQQLFGSNNLVVARREQENWASYHRQINRVSERHETASCKLIVLIEPLNDLKIISAGEIDSARVPFTKERDQP